MSSAGQAADTTPPDPWDTAGKWLAARYQLTNRDRDRVKTATIRGQPVSDPRLREVVLGLASEILDKRVRAPEIMAYYTTGAVAGVIGIVALAIALSPLGQHSHWEPRLIGLVILAAIVVVMYFVWLVLRD